MGQVTARQAPDMLEPAADIPAVGPIGNNAVDGAVHHGPVEYGLAGGRLKLGTETAIAAYITTRVTHVESLSYPHRFDITGAGHPYRRIRLLG